MTDWKTDLDEFVKETMAFAKSLRVEPPMPRTIVESDRIPPVKGIESVASRKIKCILLKHPKKLRQSHIAPDFDVWIARPVKRLVFLSRH